MRLWLVVALALALPAWAADGISIRELAMAAPDVLVVAVDDGLAIQPPWREMAMGGEFYGRLVPGGLSPQVLDEPASWQVTIDAASAAILEVGRKAKATDMTRTGAWKYEPRVTHWCYLRLNMPPTDRARLAVAAPGLSEMVEVDFRRQLSPSIHVSAAGFAGSEPKFAYLSCWAGTMGGLSFAAVPTFQILDAKSRVMAYEGKPVRRRQADQPGDDVYGNNFQKADVWSLDFTALHSVGRYVVYIPGMGCSRPFDIGPNAYREAWQTTARGLYFQRCGTMLKEEHAGAWARPACHGGKLYESRLSVWEVIRSDWGDTRCFAELEAQATPDLLTWEGGWHDAGDWDRRAQHLFAAATLLDLALILPEAFGDGELNLPESGNRVADIIDEALWVVDFFARGQRGDGAVRGGIESDGHPEYGRAAWTDRRTLYAFAPDAWSSYVFAWVAAKAARALQERHPGRAAAYQRRAEDAWQWAQAHGPLANDRERGIGDMANAAAAELLALTEKPSYAHVFAATSAWRRNPEAPVRVYREYDQRAGAFTYASAVKRADPELRRQIVVAVLADAEEALAGARERTFRFAGRRQRPMSWGLSSCPDAEALIYAWALTGDDQYRAAVATSCAWTLGGNPMNLVWVSGLGQERVRHLLDHNSWYRERDDVAPGQVPSGCRTWRGPSMGIHGFSQRSFDPPMSAWPKAEAYTDVWYDPAMCETTVQLIASAAQAYGFLHAIAVTAQR